MNAGASKAPHDALAVLSDAILAMASGSDLSSVLQTVVDRARDLVGARYAALAVPHADGERILHFLTSGLTASEIEAIGPPPSGRGVLGTVIRLGTPLRLDDVTTHPDSVGFPRNHPPMRSFLGVPIRRGTEVLGHLYLTEKLGATSFSAEDEMQAQLLARHAALAIVNSRLIGRLRTSEQRYRALTERAPDLVFALDASGRMAFVNERARAIDDDAQRSWIGRSLSDLVMPEDTAAVRDHVASALAGSEREQFHARLVDSQGAQRHWDFSVVPSMDDEGGTMLLGSARDVTERHYLAGEIAVRTAELASTRRERRELRDFVALVIQAQEEERARIAGDLHDTTVQTLTAIGRRLRSLAGGVTRAAGSEGVEPATGNRASESAGAAGVADVDREELALLAAAALEEAEEVRRLSRNLRPSALDHLGLAAALEDLADGLRNEGVDVVIETRGEVNRLDDRSRTALFRVAQEALTNIRRHSNATHALVRVEVADSSTTLGVRDDGSGISAEKLSGPGGLGIRGMRERIAGVGGTFEIGAAPGGGTLVRAEVPLRGRS